MQHILVPEVALRLILEDRGLEGDKGMEEALEILRDSSSYGVAMFPVDGGEWGENKKQDKDQMGEGDLIVMERARRRRKELDEEDESEKQRQDLEVREREKQDRNKWTRRGGQERSSGVNEPVERRQLRPLAGRL